jgi:hypothetical protein
MANLFSSSEGRRRGLAKQPPSLARRIKGFVNCLLHVAAGLHQHFAHLAGHIAGILLLALLQQQACADQNLGPLGRRNQPPRGKGLFCGGHGQLHVVGVGRRKCAHHIGVAGRVQVQDGFAAQGRLPLAADQIVKRGKGHENLQNSGNTGNRGQGQWRTRRILQGPANTWICSTVSLQHRSTGWRVFSRHFPPFDAFRYGDGPLAVQ